LKTAILALAAIAPVLPAAAQTSSSSSDVIWVGDFEAGTSSLGGNCNAGQNQWCNDEIIRPQQMQVVQDPVVQGKYALRVEVKFGDVYNGYSDSRSLMTGPPQLWEDEGNERWYRWQTMWPVGYVGTYPKWDQLSDPTVRSNAGSVVEWHHDGNGAVETGSAPLYIGADDNYIWLCLVDQTTGACREHINLASLIRGHWHDFVVHAKWSSDPTVGFLDIWVDGVHVLPMHMCQNKYPGMRNYLVAGLYRNGEIGDPNLLYPDGTHVYGTDGTPGVIYLDGFIVGKTQASVLAEALLTDPPPASDAGTPTDGGVTPPADPGSAGDAGTPADPTPPPAADAGTPPKTSSKLSVASALGASCSSGGVPMAWVGLIVVAFVFAQRRARRRSR
jgi:hypothetical protein